MSADHIADTVRSLRASLPEGVELVAVSKFHPAGDILRAYAAGQRLFGESRVQELVAKQDAGLPADIRWHFIGHLQTNKVRRLIGRTDLIESIDSERLLRLVDDESAARGLVTRVLLQVHVAAEETKTGFSPDELLDFFRRGAYTSLRATHICGLMGMASNTPDEARVRADFAAVAALRARIADLCPDLRGFDTLSMGMSHDYPLAVEAGATLVRVGSAIFGPREQPGEPRG